MPGHGHAICIRRDPRAFAHIQAADRWDALYGQGFVHAQDRLWQMELNRRLANGMLAAILGPAALPTDRLTRTLGFRRLAEASWRRADQSLRDDLMAYSDGVNAWLGLMRHRPLEFRLLGCDPAPWRPLDSLAFARLLAWSLSSGWAAELTRAKLLEVGGPALLAECEPGYPAGNPHILPHEVDLASSAMAAMLEAAAGPFLWRGPEGSGRGSNAWAVAGRRTASGRPILASDMHLPMTAPSLWYYNELEWSPAAGEPGCHVTGVSQPGLPYVLVGHNERVGWGATLSFIDVEDLYVERLRPDDPELYQTAAGWRRLETELEVIPVRGRRAHTEHVRRTQHGPLIGALVGDGRQELSLASMALEPTAGLGAFAALNLAQDWDRFLDAGRQIGGPSLNLVYADVGGNIGYLATGRVPIRAAGDNRLPAPGWDGQHEWRGLIPAEHMPAAFNPPEGLIVCANHKIAGDDYPYDLGACWRNGFRAARLVELLDDDEPLTLEASMAAQLDCTSLPGRAVAAAMAEWSLDSATRLAAARLLASWDGQMAPDSPAAAVYRAFVGQFSRRLLAPRLGETLAAESLGLGPHPVLYPLSELHGQWSARLLEIVRGAPTELLGAELALSKVAAEALEAAENQLTDLLGAQPDEWSWGRLHQLTCRHALSAVSPLDRLFDVGSFAVGGDGDTPFQTAGLPFQLPEPVLIAPNYRQVLDLGAWEECYASHAPGQSGMPESAHYDDLMADWLAGRYYRMGWSLASELERNLGGTDCTRLTLRLL
ncbi:MAG: penicillin acylase family protein [Candidatus Promineifilaceae bacterium]